MNTKAYPTIGACGIDCGLCPMHHMGAGNGCGGCTAPAPSGAKGRWCAISRCAVRDRGYETCADCQEFPCHHFEGWDRGDSFVSHLRSITNLHTIREEGTAAFVARQGQRMCVLEAMLEGFDDGRSKSYCCLASALLPLDELEKALDAARLSVEWQGLVPDDRKGRARLLRSTCDTAAERLGVSLRLRHSTGT